MTIRRHNVAAYRSGLEVSIAADLKRHGVSAAYEMYHIPYVRPQSNHKYTPDWVLPNNIIIEGKGLFDTADRAKHQLIQKQYPELDIRIIFSNPNSKLYKGSPTTYGAWCDKNNILYAKKTVPVEWLKEPKGDRACPFSVLVAKK